MSIYSLDSSFRQLFPLSHLFSETKAKKLPKNYFYIESKVELSGEFRFKTSKDSTT